MCKLNHGAKCGCTSAPPWAKNPIFTADIAAGVPPFSGSSRLASVCRDLSLNNFSGPIPAMPKGSPLYIM